MCIPYPSDFPVLLAPCPACFRCFSALLQLHPCSIIRPRVFKPVFSPHALTARLCLLCSCAPVPVPRSSCVLMCPHVSSCVLMCPLCSLLCSGFWFVCSFSWRFPLPAFCCFGLLIIQAGFFPLLPFCLCVSARGSSPFHKRLWSKSQHYILQVVVVVKIWSFVTWHHLLTVCLYYAIRDANGTNVNVVNPIIKTFKLYWINSHPDWCKCIII